LLNFHEFQILILVMRIELAIDHYLIDLICIIQILFYWIFKVF